jgi:hypothetical protein
MMHRSGFWELVGVGVAVGGTGVWGLAASAHTGLLRLLLEQFPRTWWETLTWGLIPALLLLPLVLQGVAVALLAARRRAVLWSLWGSVAGTAIAAAVFGSALILGVRHLPSPALVVLARTAPVSLVVGFLALILAGWVIVLALLLRIRGLPQAALPLGAIGTALAWMLARGHVLALSYALDHPEAQGFFASVALGGAIGSAWGAWRAAGEDLTREASVEYNPPAPDDPEQEASAWGETPTRTGRHA